eukprot:scaffold649_cov347-Pavlova_lutheri.AAC.46
MRSDSSDSSFKASKSSASRSYDGWVWSSTAPSTTTCALSRTSLASRVGSSWSKALNLACNSRTTSPMSATCSTRMFPACATSRNTAMNSGPRAALGCRHLGSRLVSHHTASLSFAHLTSFSWCDPSVQASRSIPSIAAAEPPTCACFDATPTCSSIGFASVQSGWFTRATRFGEDTPNHDVRGEVGRLGRGRGDLGGEERSGR